MSEIASVRTVRRFVLRTGVPEILKVHSFEFVDVICFNKVRFLEKVLPQATQLPQTNDFLKKCQISGESSVPGSAAAPDK